MRNSPVLWGLLMLLNGYAAWNSYVNMHVVGWAIFSFALFAYSAWNFAKCVIPRDEL